MHKYLLSFIFILVTLNTFAQKQSLTLEDAVLRRFSDFAPERYSNLQWAKGQEALTYIDRNANAIKRFSTNVEAADILMDADKLKEKLDLDLRRMPSISWLSSNAFYFRAQNAYYYWDIGNGSGEKLLEIPENAQNTDFHPASSQLAYTRDNNLYVANNKFSSIPVTANDDPNIVSGQAIARYEFGIGKGTFWSPNGRYLAFYQKDETDVSNYPLLDISTIPGTLNEIKYPMAGQKSEYAKVGIFDSERKHVYYLDVDGPKDQYLTNVGWGPEEQFLYVVIVNRDQNAIKLNKYSAQDGKLVKTLLEESHPKYVEPEHPVWFIPGKKDEFLWFSERDGFNHLYRYNTDGKLLNQVTKGPWVVLKILGLDQSRKKVIVSGTDETGLNQWAYTADLDTDQAEAIDETPGVHSYDLSSDGTHLLDVYSNLNTPLVERVIDLKGKVQSFNRKSADPLANHKIGKTEIVQIMAADGKTPLHGRIIKPSNFDSAQKYPVVVYVYGGPHAQMLDNRWLAKAPLWMYYMAEKGYVIFTVDNRGSANRGLEFENIIHRQLGTLEMEDQLAGVEYLKKQPWADTERMAIHGWSFGGFMTCTMMLRSPGTFQAGVAGGPVTDWAFYEVMYGERYMDRPEENPEGYKKARLMNYVDDLEGDLLLIHGTIDDVVVMQHNFALVKAFVDAGKQVDFFPYPMHPHNVRGRDRVHLMEKVLTYIEEHLEK